MKFLPDDEDQLNLDEPSTTDDLQDVEPQSKMRELLDSNIDDQEQSLDAENQANEDLGAKLTSADEEPDLKEEAPKQSSQLEQFQNFLQQYKQLQENRRKSDLVAGLVAAGGKIGQSMAGKYSGKFDPDMTGYNVIKQMGERPVSDFEQAQVLAGRQQQLQQSPSIDPNSSQSKLVREYLKQRIPNMAQYITDDMSASDASNLIKQMGHPLQSRFQSKTGTGTNPKTGQKEKMNVSYDPTSGQAYLPGTNVPIPDFISESTQNPFGTVVDPNTGKRLVFNRSSGTTSNQIGGPQSPVGQATNPQEVNAFLDPVTRKELNDKIKPEFTKETEKIQQRLHHVDVILQRLKEAQTNPAALPQLKAEMARFDVGDQRLAQQEFEMFAKRQGYKGFQDWMQAHSTGTITPDFANDMAQAVTHVSESLKNQISESAEKHAKEIVHRLPPGQKVDPKLIAPLLYGNYKQQSKLLKEKASGKMVPIKADKYNDALKSGYFEKPDDEDSESEE